MITQNYIFFHICNANCLSIYTRAYGYRNDMHGNIKTLTNTYLPIQYRFIKCSYAPSSVKSKQFPRKRWDGFCNVIMQDLAWPVESGGDVDNTDLLFTNNRPTSFGKWYTSMTHIIHLLSLDTSQENFGNFYTSVHINAFSSFAK